MAITPECASGIWLWFPFIALLVAIALDVYLWWGVKNGSLVIANPTAVKVGPLMVNVAAAVGVSVLMLNRTVCQ